MQRKHSIDAFHMSLSTHTRAHTHTHTYRGTRTREECLPRDRSPGGQVVHLVRVEVAGESVEEANALVATAAPVDKDQQGFLPPAQFVFLKEGRTESRGREQSNY